jgi:hypothetical protein
MEELLFLAVDRHGAQPGINIARWQRLTWI